MADKRINIGIGYTVDKSGLEEMQSYFQRIANMASEPGANMNAGLKQAGQTAKTLDEILEKTFNANLGTLNVTRFNQELQKSNLTMKQVKSDLTAIGTTGVTAYAKLANAILSTNIQLKQSSKLLDSMFTTFKNTIRYGISSSIFNNFTNSISKAYEYTKKLDTSLNNIRIVTGKSAAEMDKFAEKANSAAKQIGASTLDMTEASLIYYQQGLSDTEAQARAETTVKVANVTGQNAEEVSEQLTAVWNGYKVSASEAEMYIDKLAAVAATTASDLEELSTGMSKVASAAASMGVEFDDLTAQISTIVSVTRQAPESVGTALKTIYARIGDLKVDGIDEFGVKLGEVSSQMKTMGIEILDQQGNMRNMTSIMTEVAEKWNTWTEAQKQAAAVAIAGKRQYNNLIALFENWDMYSKALDTAKDSVGTLQKQQDIYMQSTKAKLNQLRATWQGLYKTIFNTSGINTMVDTATNLVQVLDNFSESLGGGMKSIIAYAMVIANIFNKQIYQGINNAISRFDTLKSNANTMQQQYEIANSRIDPSNNQNIDEQAELKRFETQAKYANDLQMAAAGLNEEQILIVQNNSTELGLMDAEKVKLEHQLEILKNKAGLTSEEIAQLRQSGAYIEDITDNYEKEGQQLARNKTTLDNIVKGQSNIKDKIKSVLEDVVEINEEYNLEKIKLEDIATELSNQNLSEEERNKLEQEALQIINRIDILNNEQIQDNNKKTAAARKYNDTLQNTLNLEQRRKRVAAETNEILKQGQRGANIGKIVTTITGSVSSLAMTWSSLNSVIRTWADDSISTGDKVVQSIFAISMAVSTLSGTFVKLREVFGFSTNLVVAYRANLAKLKAEEEARILLNTVIIRQEREKVKETAAEVKAQYPLIVASIQAGEEQAAKMALNTAYPGTSVAFQNAVYAETKALLAEDAAAKETEKSLLRVIKTPIGITLAVFAALAASLVAISAATKKNNEEQLKYNKTIIESNKLKREEVETNKELYDSYQNVYGQYLKGKSSKEELADATDKLIDKYHIEGAELAKLTGKYEDVSEAIKKAREQELKEAKEDTEKAGKAAKQNLMLSARLSSRESKGGRISNLFGTEGAANFSPGITILGELDEREAIKIAQSNGFLQDGVRIEAVYKNEQELLDLYDRVEKTVSQMQEELESSELVKSEVYTNMVNWLSDMSESVEEYRAALEKIEEYKNEGIFVGADIEATTSLKEYYEKVEQITKNLTTLGRETDEIDEILYNYAKTSTNEFVKQGAAIRDLVNKYSEVKKLNLKDQVFLLTADIDLKGFTAKEIEKKIEIEKNKISPNNLTIPISLMAKISSDKKLTKEELKEQIAEESRLAKDYEVEFANFSQQSSLGQNDILNRIIQNEVNNREAYLDNVIESAKKELEVNQSKYERLKQQRKDYQKIIDKYAENGGVKNEQEWKEFKEAQQGLKDLNIELTETDEKIQELQRLTEDGLSFDELDTLNFETWTNGIDATIQSVKTLGKSIEDIAEGWSIAAENIEEFAMNYPSILADQENFNYLQDGSIALTEKGQELLKSDVALRKEDLKAQGQAYMIELEKQADLQYAQAAYYQDQIDALEEYLSGAADGAKTEKKLRESVYNYSAKVAELTGKTNEEVMSQIIDNSNINRENEQTNDQAIFDYWVDCGKAVAAYGEAVLSKQHKYTPPTPDALKGRNTGSNLSSEDLHSFDETYQEQLKQELGFYSDRDKEQEEEFKALVKEQINSLIKKRDAAIAQGDIEMAKRSSYDAMIHSLEATINNLGKGKDSKKDNTKYEDEFDRYYDIKKAIDLVSNALDKLSKVQEKLHGKELIQSLKNENDLIKQQAKNYELLYKSQENELSELQTKLASFGAEFDANGYLTNYTTLTKSIFEQYQALVANGLAEEAKTFYEQSYEDFKKYLERYDALFYSEMKDTRDKLDEENRKLMENNLKIWETGIQIRLDTSQAKRDWSDFLKEINSDFRKVYKNLSVEMSHLMTKVETYAGFGTIQTDLEAIQQVMAEIDKLAAGQGSDMFESISDAQEKLKELDKTLEDDAKNMKSLWEEAWNIYLEGIDQANEELDFVNDRYEKINEELEFQSTLINLLYGEEAYKLMSKLYQGQEEASRSHIQSIKEQSDMWHQLWVESGATLENQSEWTTAQQKYYENWQTQQSKLNDLVTSYIELLQKDYLNTVNDVLASLEKTLTGGSTLERVKEQWERITSYSDKYFDNIEQAYEAQKFANKINQDIAKMNDIKNQQKLQVFRDKEISYLREKENLTKYDLDAAEARYQIALKEIALQEAQENKTSMKLVRNEQGNWSYQYMADADEVSEKQNDLLNAFGDLYKLAGDAYQDNLDSAQELANTYMEKVKEIHSNQYMAEEEKEQRLLELRTWYMEEQKRLVAADQLYREDLQKSGSGLLLQIYKQDEAAYNYMTTSERAMIDGLVKANIADYQKLEELVEANFGGIGDSSEILMGETRNDWTATARDLIKVWAADDGVSVKSAILNADKAISIAMVEYTKLVDECALQVERDFGEKGIGYAINYATKQTNILESAVADLINRSVSALGGLKSAFAEMGAVWEGTATKINSAIGAIQHYLAIEGKTNAIFADTYTPTPGPGVLPRYAGGSEYGDNHSGQWIIQAVDRSVNRKVIVDSKGWATQAEAKAEVDRMKAEQGKGAYKDLTFDDSSVLMRSAFRYGVGNQAIEPNYNVKDNSEAVLSYISQLMGGSSGGTVSEILQEFLLNRISSFMNASQIPSYSLNNYGERMQDLIENKTYNIHADFSGLTESAQVIDAILGIDRVADQKINKFGY